jgi:hypothetical protein
MDRKPAAVEEGGPMKKRAKQEEGNASTDKNFRDVILVLLESMDSELLFLSRTWNQEENMNLRKSYLEDLKDFASDNRFSSRTFDEKRLAFRRTFRNDLTLSERCFLLKQLKGGDAERNISLEEIQVFLLKGPFFPVYVSLSKTKQTSKAKMFQNGSIHFPFSTMKAAEDLYEKQKRSWSARDDAGITNDVVLCSIQVMDSDCPDRQECFHPQCNVKVCKEHGTGRAYPDNDNHGSLEFYRCVCTDCPKVACTTHERLWKDCRSCKERIIAECRLQGCHCTRATCFKVCAGCGSFCRERIRDHAGRRSLHPVCMLLLRFLHSTSCMP